MRHHKFSTLIRWATEGRIESANDIVVGKLIEVRFTASGKYAWVQVEAG
jgi:hypothetical protein